MKHKTTILTSLACLIPLLLGVILYNKLPESIATHFNSEGIADDYSSKNFTVFILPLIFLMVNLFVSFMINNDPKKANVSQKMKNLLLWLIPVLSNIVMSTTFGLAMGIKLDITTIVFSMVGILFTVLGIILPKLKRNYTIGIKLPWTLNDDYNWEKTHSLAGKIWIIGGIILFINGIFNMGASITVLVIILLILIPTIYSYLIFKNPNN